MSKIGDRIKTIRESQNISQLELAEKIGKTQQDISRWEKSRNRPTINILLQLSVGLNCTVQDLLGSG
jgi:transcriptional regulator with XRE-family HTH domain